MKHHERIMNHESIMKNTLGRGVGKEGGDKALAAKTSWGDRLNALV